MLLLRNASLLVSTQTHVEAIRTKKVVAHGLDGPLAAHLRVIGVDLERNTAGVNVLITLILRAGDGVVSAALLRVVVTHTDTHIHIIHTSFIIGGGCLRRDAGWRHGPI